MKKYFRFVGLLFVLILACGQTPQTRFYTLDLSLPQQVESAEDTVLYIEAFRAIAPYDQDRLVYRPARFEIQFDSYRRWVTSPADLLYESAVRYFRASSTFGQVETILPEKPCYRISATVHAFDEVAIGSDHVAALSLWVEVNDAQGNTIVQRQFRQQQPIQQITVMNILSSMSLATENLFAELDEQIRSAIR